MAVSHVLSNANANWANTVTVFNSQGSSTTIAATNLIRPQDWNSVHNQYYTLSGNTAVQSSASGTNPVFSAAGQFTLAGSTGSLVFSGPPLISSFENFAPAGTMSMTLAGASISHAVAFQLPEGGSFSFVRIPVLMTTGSTTLATSATTGACSAFVYSTWNAVAYSMNVGASSASLVSVASGSAGFTFENFVSISNTTQFSITQLYSYPIQGNQTSTSTQYSISNTNVSLVSTAFHSLFSTARMLDIPFANSLVGGPYWLVFGYSSSSTTSTNAAAITNAANYTANIISYSNHYGASQLNVGFGLMGSTAITSGGFLGAGSFSTAGGGTTSGFPLANICSSASNVRPYFQMQRSA